ncbi:MAG: hypothetical protein A3J48_03260 [Candidatus Doudnabacteria bacterium RIFCSPHIGHO2_02_FULL_46_11]|uniref:ABC transporter ATP-binding protein n=1 Tax=Candidatus Doudnabacteria bacterium RIFCSPHIGHO2_02_FULL_46_11 TaxID=1817832 RepID=A0A1F5P843_9BACT|nr:MAG: hypothetical protein A3J48_03260 [Candidatus Doudnabacteria bacterium RIFCSPHIGHO2_02_FULL_46_11]
MKNYTRQTYKIFWNHAKRYKLVLFVMIIGLILANLAEVYAPIWYKRLIDLVSSNQADKFDQGVRIVIFAWLTHMMAWLFWRINTFVNNYFQPRVMADLLNTCFKYLQLHSFTFFSNNFAGSLVKKTTRYERSFENIADQMYWHIGQTVIRFLLIFAVMWWVNVLFALILAVWVALYFYLHLKFTNFKLKYDIQKAELDSKMSGFLADTITNNLNIKFFGGYKRESKSFADLNEKHYKIRKWTWDLAAMAEAGQSFMMVALELLLLYVALRLWRTGAVTVGDFVLIQVYLSQLFGRLWELGRYIRQIYESLADAEEMTEILVAPHEIQDLPGAAQLRVEKGEIDFKSITFGYYENTNTFKKFDFKIRAGERVALVGPSGGGKTTIVKLLLRFHDLDKGEISIDGQDISKITQESLRANIALVPQEPILFHRGLMENIRYARPNATDQEVIKAAKLAHAHEFISSFPDGYDTYVGERGIKLSGGERQRVAIARAILKDAPIFILDEATSSLDSESELFIQDALRNLMKGKTTIVVAHRLSTIMQMDRIVVIEKGKIIEEGKHEELVKAKQGIYQKLWKIQAGGFAE